MIAYQEIQKLVFYAIKAVTIPNRLNVVFVFVCFLSLLGTCSILRYGQSLHARSFSNLQPDSKGLAYQS